MKEWQTLVSSWSNTTGDRFSPGELKMMKKDCFYAGLKEHNKYLVSHVKDQDQYGLAQMLKEIQE